jgi:hypothetical protein
VCSNVCSNLYAVYRQSLRACKCLQTGRGVRRVFGAGCSRQCRPYTSTYEVLVRPRCPHRSAGFDCTC